jgi:hypothetical protein
VNRSRAPTELSASDEWATPAWLFDYAAKRYGPFDLDVAAASWNAKSEGYWARDVEGPGGRYLGVWKHWAELGPVVQTVWEDLAVELTLINRRVDYVHESGRQTNNSRHPSALVVFARPGVLRPLVQMSGNPQGAP